MALEWNSNFFRAVGQNKPQYVINNDNSYQSQLFYIMILIAILIIKKI